MSHWSPVSALAYHPSGEALAIGDDGRQVRMYRINSRFECDYTAWSTPIFPPPLDKWRYTIAVRGLPRSRTSGPSTRVRSPLCPGPLMGLTSHQVMKCLTLYHLSSLQPSDLWWWNVYNPLLCADEMSKTLSSMLMKCLQPSHLCWWNVFNPLIDADEMSTTLSSILVKCIQPSHLSWWNV